MVPWAYIFSHKRCSFELAKEILMHVPADSQYEGKTPLHWAIEYGRIDIARWLLEKNANPKYPDNQGMTPWAYLFSNNCSFELAKEILTHVSLDSQCKGKMPLHWAAKYGRTDIARWLLENNANRRCLDVTHNSPLGLALKNHNVGVILLLFLSHIRSHISAYSLGLATSIAVICLGYKKLNH